MNRERAEKWVDKNYPKHTDKESLIVAYMAGTTSMVDYLNEQNKKKEDRVKAKKLEFAERLKPFVAVHGRDFMNNFYGYWSEADLRTGKLRWEKETAFEIERRITTFKNNQFGKKPITESSDKKYKEG